MTNFRQVLGRFVDIEVIVNFTSGDGAATSRGILREFGDDYLMLEAPASNIWIPCSGIMKIVTPITGAASCSKSLVSVV